MDITIVKVIVKPSINITSGNYSTLSQQTIEKDIALDSRILVKDLCRQIMEKIGLQDLVNQSQAFIQHSNLEYYPLSSFVPDMNIKIGSVTPLLKSELVVKILVPLKSDDFVKMEEVNVLCRKLIQYLLSEVPDVENHLPSAIIQARRNCQSIRQFPLETLIQMNEEIIGSMNRSTTPTSNAGQNSSLFSTPRMYSNSFDARARYHGVMFNDMEKSFCNLPVFSGGNSYPKSFQVSHEKVSQGTTPYVCRVIRYNKEVEVPILEQWYKTLAGASPTYFDFQNYASALNILSFRDDHNKITAKNIHGWYKRRKASERKEANQRRQADEREQRD
uniref:Homeobox domain-containing protein n=1 Tax=Strongyloides papillosus TaxID=174720 RepID=A0A0N5BTI6_STREA